MGVTRALSIVIALATAAMGAADAEQATVPKGASAPSVVPSAAPSAAQAPAQSAAPPESAAPVARPKTPGDLLAERRLAGIAVLIVPADLIPLEGLPRPWSSLDYEKLLDRFGIPFAERSAAIDAEFDRYVETWRSIDADTLDVLAATTDAAYFTHIAMPYPHLAEGRAASARLRAAANRVIEAMVLSAPDQLAAQEEARVVRRALDRQIIRAELGPRWLRAQTTDVAELLESFALTPELRAQTRAALEPLQPAVDRLLKEIRSIRERREGEWRSRLGPPPSQDAPEETRKAWWTSYQAAASDALAEVYAKATEMCDLNFEALERLEPVLSRDEWRRLRGRLLADTLVWNSTLEHGVDPFRGARYAVEKAGGDDLAARLAHVDSLEQAFRRDEAELQKEFVAAANMYMNRLAGVATVRRDEEADALFEIDTRVYERWVKAYADLGRTEKPHRPATTSRHIYTRPIERSSEPGMGQQNRRSNLALDPRGVKVLSQAELDRLLALAGGGDDARSFCEAARGDSAEIVAAHAAADEAASEAAREAATAAGHGWPPPRAPGDWKPMLAGVERVRDSTMRLEPVESALFAGLAGVAPDSAKPAIAFEERRRRFDRLLESVDARYGSGDIGELAWSGLHRIDLVELVHGTALGAQSQRELAPLLEEYWNEAIGCLEHRRDTLPAMLAAAWEARDAAQAAKESPDARTLNKTSSTLELEANHRSRSLEDVNLRWLPTILGAVSARADRERLQLAIWHAWWPTLFENSTLAARTLAAARARSDLSPEAASVLAALDDSVHTRLLAIDRECAAIAEFGFGRRGTHSMAPNPRDEDERNRTLDRRAWERAEITASALRAIERTIPAQWEELRPRREGRRMISHSRNTFDR